jgi:hypothetical protein
MQIGIIAVTIVGIFAVAVFLYIVISDSLTATSDGMD